MIPHDPSYPGFDVFYFHRLLKRLYVIQITTRQDPVSHVNDNDGKNSIVEALKCWRYAFLPADTEIIEIWYIGKQKFQEAPEPHQRKKDSLNVIFFEDGGLPLLNLV